MEIKSSNGNNTIVTWTVRGFVGTIFVIVTFSMIDNTFTFVVRFKLQNVLKKEFSEDEKILCHKNIQLILNFLYIKDSSNGLKNMNGLL